MTERKCGLDSPAAWKGMDIDWPFKKRDLGDEIVYHCPNNKLTWAASLEEQVVTCIWHRQTDTMLWWPQDLHDCNSQYQTNLPVSRERLGGWSLQPGHRDHHKL